MTAGRVTTKKTWDQVMRNLREELRMWKVTDYVLPYRGDSEQRGEVVFIFRKDGNERTITVGKYTRELNGMAKNLSAIKDAIHYVRMMDQRGIGDVLLDVAQVLQLNEYDAYRVLGVTRESSKAEIQRAAREKMSTSHPDKTGSRLMYDVYEKAARDLGVN